MAREQFQSLTEQMYYILLALLEQFNVSPQWVRTGEGERHFVTSVDKVASLYGMKVYPHRRTDRREQ